MKDTGYIDHDTANAVKDILAQEPEPNSVQQEAEFILNYYKTHYDFVQTVHCEGCGALLCLWVLELGQVKQNTHVHPQGLRRIEMGNDLKSTRKRHDGVVGYRCGCGANSLVAEVEKEYVTQSSTHVPADAPHVAALVQKKILARNWQPKIEQIDGDTIVEGFRHRRIK